jgi:hypothetical protein
MHLLSPKTKSSDLVEDLVSGLRPREVLAPRVVCLDVCEEGLAQLRHFGLSSRRNVFSVSMPKNRSRD